MDIDQILHEIGKEVVTHSAENFWDQKYSHMIQLRSQGVDSIFDYLGFENENFVVHCFERLLGRSPKPEELAGQMSQFDGTQAGKLLLMRRLTLSPEFRANPHRVRVEGLYEFDPIFSSLLAIRSDRVFVFLCSAFFFGYLARSERGSLLDLLTKRGGSKKQLMTYLHHNYPYAPQGRVRLRKLLRKFTELLLRMGPWSHGRTEVRQGFFLESLLVKHQQLKALSSSVSEQKRMQVDLASLSYRVDQLKSQLGISQNGPGPSVRETTGQGESRTWVELPSFYFEHEKRFRGSEDLIKERLKEYLPFVLKAHRVGRPLPVLDVGFGRCEWMQLLNENGIQTVGVDIDQDLVKRAKEKGYTVHLDDALNYLAGLEESSLSMVTAFQVVEHMPFEVVKQFVHHCHRVLKPGGCILFETPNPENLIVGSHDFWLDPTHVKPIPHTVLSFWVEMLGFSDVETIKKNPYNLLQGEGLEHPSLKNLLYRVNLERDYSVVGWKD